MSKFLDNSYKKIFISFLFLLLIAYLERHHPVQSFFICLYFGISFFLVNKKNIVALIVLSLSFSFFLIYYRMLGNYGTTFENDQIGLAYKILLSQLPVYISAVTLQLFTIYTKRKTVKVLLFIFSFLLFLIVLCDVFTFRSFHTHFSFSDILNFKNDIITSYKIILSFFSQSFFFVVCLLIYFLCIVACLWINESNLRWYFSFLVVLCIAFSLSPKAKISIFDEAYENVFSAYSYESEAQKKYSDNSMYSKYEPNTLTFKGLNSRKNVILVFVESLSADESVFFNGTHNDLPELDKIAKDNLSFLNYYSMSYNTDCGNVSFLYSTPFLHGDHSNYPKFQKNSLIQILNSKGYSTKVFFSAKEVGGLNRIWNSVGFKEFFDGNDPFYNNSERMVFDSVPDKDMFDNVLNKMNTWGKNPYFCMIMTTTSHYPYQIPNAYGGGRGYSECINYIDSSLKSFYDSLQERNFFENGILVITGDHRAMLPYSSEENTLHGEVGMSRVPLIIVDKSFPPKVYKNKVGHSSLSGMLEYLLLDQFMIDDSKIIPFIDEFKNKNQSIYYQFHFPPNKVIVSIGRDGLSDFERKQDECTVFLNGDDTSLNSRCNYSKDEAEKVLSQIAYFRR